MKSTPLGSGYFRPSRLDLATKLGDVSRRVHPLVHVKGSAAERGWALAMFGREGRSPSWRGRHVPDGWWIVVYPEAGEAVPSFRRGLQGVIFGKVSALVQMQKSGRFMKPSAGLGQRSVGIARRTVSIGWGR